MSYLEDLIGKSLHEISDAELDEIITKGRLAREERAPTKAKATSAKKPSSIPDIDLDDF